MRTATDILAQLQTGGILCYIVHQEPHGEMDTTLRGIADLAVLAALRADPRFLEGDWHHLHAKHVGSPRTEFRSVRGALAPDSSLQFVVNTVSGVFETDVDRFNTQDVANIVGHLGGEVVPNWLKKIGGWFRRA
jgi:hypothetical protein